MTENHMKTIAAMQAASAEVDRIITDKLRAYDDGFLLWRAQNLCEHVPSEALRMIADEPSDTSAMLAAYYYRELFRRVELKAMDTEVA